MATFYISTFKPPNEEEDSDYRIDSEKYEEAMLQRWPHANVGRMNFEHYSLSWELDKETELGAPGKLHSTGTVVAFGTNPKKDAIDFVLWHRAFVPDKYLLYLFDESLQTIHELKPDMTEEELEHIFT